MTTRLVKIATRHRKNRLRDGLFAVCVALAIGVSGASLSTAFDAASTSHVAQR